MTTSSRILSLVAALALAALPASAVNYTIGDELYVKAQTVSPSQTVRIEATGLGRHNVLAGIVELSIKSIGSVEALCIDPFQWAERKEHKYTVTALEAAAPGSRTIGTENAKLLGKLWALYFDNVGNDPSKAAGLQIAVWMVVGGNGFSLLSGSDFGARKMIETANESKIAGANLVALTNSAKQDFVVRQVPDGGATVLLLGLGLTGLAILRRRA